MPTPRQRAPPPVRPSAQRRAPRPKRHGKVRTPVPVRSSPRPLRSSPASRSANRRRRQPQAMPADRSGFLIRPVWQRPTPHPQHRPRLSRPMVWTPPHCRPRQRAQTRKTRPLPAEAPCHPPQPLPCSRTDPAHPWTLRARRLLAHHRTLRARRLPAHRRTLRARRLPAHHRTLLARNLPLYRRSQSCPPKHHPQGHLSSPRRQRPNRQPPSRPDPPPPPLLRCPPPRIPWHLPAGRQCRRRQLPLRPLPDRVRPVRHPPSRPTAPRPGNQAGPPPPPLRRL